MIKLAVAGACGRMGRRILTLAAQDKNFRIVAAFENRNHPDEGKPLSEVLGVACPPVKITTDASEAFRVADAVIDFTHHSALESNLKWALRHKTAYVVGTTGLGESHRKLLKQASKKIAIVQSPNMSVGVNLLFKLSEIAAKVLDEDYDLEISETHHRMKKDSPSGTAVKLLEILAAARGRDIAKNTVYGREGETGARPRGEIGVLAMRGGDVVGDHTVFFFGDGERVELTHRASSRDAFAQGALRAAKFVAKRRYGLYDMQQVLGIASAS